MSTVYFTNNADSGDGSLRDAITNCAAGDTISPQGFAEGDITILLGSYLPTKSFTLDAGENNRIILDGQGTSDFFRIGLAATETTFNKITFQNGVRDSSAPFYASAFTSLTFNRCAFLNNSGASGFIAATTTASGSFTFDSCYAFGNTATNAGRAGVLYFPTSSKADATLVGCTFGGTVGGVPDVLDGGQTSLQGSLVENFNGETTDFTSMIDASTGDYRLKPSSEFLRGGWPTGVDYLGHARDGSRGAFAGSWLVVKDSATITENTTVDYAVFCDGSATTFTQPRLILRATRGLTVGSATLGTTVDSSGYLVLADESNIDSTAMFDGVRQCKIGAEASNFKASRSGQKIVLTWTQKPGFVYVEESMDGGASWSTLNALATNGTQTASPTMLAASYLLFDGENFYTASVDALVVARELAAKISIGYIMAKNAVGYLN